MRNYLANETAKTARMAFRFVSLIKCVPFELEDGYSLRVKMFASRWKYYLWCLANFTYWMSTAFRLVTFCMEFSKKPLGEELVVHMMYVTLTCLGCLFMVVTYLKPEACVLMLNQHDFLLQATHDAGVRVPHWTTYNFPILAVLYFAWILSGMWSCHGIYYLLKPSSQHSVLSSLPVGWQESYAVIGIGFIFEQIKLAWTLGMMCAFFCVWCADIYTLNSILAVMMKKGKYTGAHVTLYYYTEIFLAAFNDFNGTVFTVGFNFLNTALPTFFIYLAIKATDLHPFIHFILLGGGVFSVFLIMYFFPQDAKVRFRSVQLLAALRARPKISATEINTLDLDFRTRKNEILNKKIESFRPLGIKIWFFGVYSLNTSIELVVQLCNNLLLLLSF